MVYFCPVNQILKNERVRDRVEKDGARKPMHNEIWAKIAQKIEGMFGWWFWKLFWKIIFDIFRKKIIFENWILENNFCS